MLDGAILRLTSIQYYIEVAVCFYRVSFDASALKRKNSKGELRFLKKSDIPVHTAGNDYELLL